VTPDVTVLIDVPVAVATWRRRGSLDDRVERQGDHFQQRVADGYRRLAAEAATPWVVIDGAGAVETVAAAVWSGVSAATGSSPEHVR
jgi:thymidylate kinase